MTDRDTVERDVGRIGPNEITIKAEGPSAQWCVDALSERVEGEVSSVETQVYAAAQTSGLEDYE